MRRFVTFLVACMIFVAVPVIAQQAQVKLAWDPNPASEQVTKYTLYELVGTTWNKVADIEPTACGATECNWTLTTVTPGQHTYALTASNLWGESGRSNEVSTPSVATAPRNVTITITITITTP